MGAESITTLLTILLTISIIILFILIIVFFILYFKKKQEENTKKNDVIKVQAQEEEVVSNIVKTKTYTTENIKNFLDFTEIKDNMILQKDGKRFVMVVHCKGVNYDLMSAVERSGVEQGFSQFLNALTRPIQIHIQARKVNLEESIARYNKRLQVIESNFYKAEQQYIEAQKNPNINAQVLRKAKLAYVRQKNLYEYTKDVIANTERLSLNQNILTKNYYISISYMPESSNNLSKEEIIELAFAELYTSAQALLRTLAACGVTGKVLDSVELADLLYVAYNRDSSETYDVDQAIRAGYDALYSTAPDVINKRIAELDKIIDEKAFGLASETIEKVTVRNRREKELKQKEKDMDKLISEMAKSMIIESQGYIPEEIIEQSVQEIDANQKSKQTKKKTVKKGA